MNILSFKKSFTSSTSDSNKMSTSFSSYWVTDCTGLGKPFIALCRFRSCLPKYSWRATSGSSSSPRSEASECFYCSEILMHIFGESCVSGLSIVYFEPTGTGSGLNSRLFTFMSNCRFGYERRWAGRIPSAKLMKWLFQSYFSSLISYDSLESCRTIC